MRIVHVITRFHRAGTEENTAITCNGQVRDGHQVTLVHGPAFTAEAMGLLDPGVGRVEAPHMDRQIHLVNDPRALLELIAIFRRLKPDVVHTHQSKAGILGRLAAAATGVRKIVHGVHILAFMNVPPRERAIYLTLEKMVAPVTHAFIHVTPALKAESIAARLGAEDQHFVVASGMDVEAFRAAAAPVDADHLLRSVGEGSGRPCIILVVSSLERRKRHLEFLAQLRRVVDAHPNVRVLFAGEGPEREAIVATAKDLGLSSNIELLGSRDDVPSLIALADICVLASEREGLPRCVIQYALGGRPIVATKLPDMERLVTEGVNGFLCDAETLEPMADRLIGLVADEALRRRMGEASRALDLSDWAADRMCERIAATYDWIDNRRAG